LSIEDEEMRDLFGNELVNLCPFKDKYLPQAGPSFVLDIEEPRESRESSGKNLGTGHKLDSSMPRRLESVLSM
jgi:hypothetical protein